MVDHHNERGMKLLRNLAHRALKRMHLICKVGTYSEERFQAYAQLDVPNIERHHSKAKGFIL